MLKLRSQKGRLNTLQKNTGVTHVLNSAEGTRIGTVNASQEFYEPFGIRYKGLKLLDTPQSNISVHFDEVADFVGMVKKARKRLRDSTS